MSKISNITKARAQLIIKQPFFASLLLSMPMVENSDIPTMATDGESILYNPAWTDTLTFDEVLFVLAHETLHCVFDHMGRRGNKTHNRWNQAADYIINGLLVADKIGTMPKVGLYDPKLVAQGNGTAEGVYNLLPESNEDKNAGDKGGALDSVFDAGTKNGTETTDQAKIKQATSERKIRIIAAKNAAKQCGKMSKGLERLIDDLLKPKIDWRESLRKFISARARVEYSYARPKRRFLGEDFYLPSLSGEQLGKIVIAVDCSGSVSPKLLTQFCTEINAIKEDLKPESIEVIYFDSEVLKQVTFGKDDEIALNPIGGGGTAFSPVIKAVNAMEEKPACVVFLTDLYCDDFGDAPEYPVLWAVMEGQQNNAPFGEVLEVSHEDSKS